MPLNPVRRWRKTTQQKSGDWNRNCPASLRDTTFQKATGYFANDAKSDTHLSNFSPLVEGFYLHQINFGQHWTGTVHGAMDSHCRNESWDIGGAELASGCRFGCKDFCPSELLMKVSNGLSLSYGSEYSNAGWLSFVFAYLCAMPNSRYFNIF